MEYRRLGRTGLEVSALGFGCGAVGGLLIKGDRKEMLRAVDRAIELGITYFDTARSYGDGASETNLGLVLDDLKPAVVVGTKVQLAVADLGDIEQAIVASAEGSLKRLRREQIDLFQLHNPIALERKPERAWIGVDDLAPAIRAFQKLQQQGKIRFWGINGLGETEALHQVVSSVPMASIQCCFNLINPSAGVAMLDSFPYQDYRQLIDAAAAKQIGAIAIRVLAGGALSGSAARHLNAARSVEPIATGQSFAEDVDQSQRFDVLVQEGYAGNLVEAAIRFAIGKAEVATALIGISDMQQLEQAAEYSAKGPLPAEALERLRQLWDGDARSVQPARFYSSLLID
ncbi:MAG TPA: aldo/keto reductase [Roseiflexaceae bacterium]|nr:aldo/keto reductase [Roseiflexaceae bacterium]